MSNRKKTSSSQKKNRETISPCCESVREKLGGEANCYSNKTACKQNNRSFSFENPEKEKLCRIDLDGCLMKDVPDIKKCDFVFVRCQNQEMFFVELKGQNNIKQAFNQITSSIVHFQEQKVIEKKEKNLNTGVIISSRMSSAQAPSRQNLKKEFQKNWGKELILESQSYKHKLK